MVNIYTLKKRLSKLAKMKKLLKYSNKRIGLRNLQHQQNQIKLKIEKIRKRQI